MNGVSDSVMRALSDLRVIELSSHIAGPFCGKLLADYGADVIKIESPNEGDEARRLGPFPNDEPDSEASGLFLYLNTNKRGVTLDIELPDGLRILRELIAVADVVIENFSPGTTDRIGLSYDSLERIRSGIVLVSITPFGQTGPWRDYQATDIVAHAASGLSLVNGDPDRTPLKEPGYESDYQAGISGLMGAMTAICNRDMTGVGQHVDVSILEASASIFAPQILGSLHSGRPMRREPRGLPAGLLPCKDGFISLNVRHEPTWQYMWIFFGEPEIADDPRFVTIAARREHQQELEDLLLPRLARYTMEELFHGLAPLRIMVGMTLGVEQLLSDPHLEEREFFARYDHPKAGEVTHPGAPFKMSETPWELRDHAPLKGQHNKEIFSGILGYADDEINRWQDEGVI